MKGLFVLGGFYEEVSSVLGLEVDVITTGSFDKAFLDKIKEDELLLYAG